MASKNWMALLHALLLSLQVASVVGLEDPHADLPECREIGGFRGDVLTQPGGCCIKRGDRRECKRIEGQKFLTRPPFRQVSNSNCTEFVRAMIQPIFSVDIKSGGGKLFEIDQAGEPQYAEQEICLKDWCTSNEDVRCEQIHAAHNYRVVLADGGTQSQELFVSAMCDCRPKSRGRSAKDSVSSNGTAAISNGTNLYNITEGGDVGFAGARDGYDGADLHTLKKAHSNNDAHGIKEELRRRKYIADSVESDHSWEEKNLMTHFLGCMGHQFGKVPLPCQFPFVYHGVNHTGCIMDDDTQFWCPTELDRNGNYKSKHWGYCSDSCPLEQRVCATNGGPMTKALCQFPFTYREIEFYDCTTMDDDTPWCATETDRHGYMAEGKWGYCACTHSEPKSKLPHHIPNYSGSQGDESTTPYTSESHDESYSLQKTTTPPSETSPSYISETSPSYIRETSPSYYTSPNSTAAYYYTTLQPTTTRKTHIPVSFSMMPQEHEGVAVYIPSAYKDVVLAVIEKASRNTVSPNTNVAGGY